MKKILPKHMIDFSTKDTFCFGVRCEECNRIWYSKKIRFSKVNVTPETEGKKIIYGVLYQREWEQARKVATELGKELFSICPVCHRLVCDSCFMICDELDMCKRCAKALEAEGKVVYTADESEEEV